MEASVIKETKSWIIRQANPADLNFITSSMLHDFRYTSWCIHTRKSVFYENYQRVLDRLLMDSQTYIACLPDDQNVVVGYVIVESWKEEPVLHYIFVKEVFRKMGVARSLYDYSGSPIIYTHYNNTAEKYFKKHRNSSMIFNPFLLYKQE